MGSISHHIMPLVINSLGGGHTHNDNSMRRVTIKVLSHLQVTGTKYDFVMPRNRSHNIYYRSFQSWSTTSHSIIYDTSLPLINTLIISTRYITAGAYNQDMDERLVFFYSLSYKITSSTDIR